MAHMSVSSSRDRKAETFLLVADPIGTPRSSVRNDDGRYTRRTPRGRLQQSGDSSVNGRDPIIDYIRTNSNNFNHLLRARIDYYNRVQSDLDTVCLSIHLLRWSWKISLSLSTDRDGRDISRELLHETPSYLLWLQFAAISTILVTCSFSAFASIVSVSLSLETTTMTQGLFYSTHHLSHRPCPIAPSI